MAKIQRRPLWVVKIGSQILIDEGPLFIRSLVRDITVLKIKYHVDVIIVTSGAIASARFRLRKTWRTLPEKQALSALGQPMIMDLYNQALLSYGQMGAQVLLTYADFKNKISRKNFINTLQQLLSWKVVPILNENDVIATDEIQFGDNDYLSALVACEMRAERLILVTNVKGLYDRNPSHKKARLISSLHNISSETLKSAVGKPAGPLGRGGMISKLLAAKKALACQIETHIVHGALPKVLLEIAEGRIPGTRIQAPLKAKVKSQKRSHGS